MNTWLEYETFTGGSSWFVAAHTGLYRKHAVYFSKHVFVKVYIPN